MSASRAVGDRRLSFLLGWVALALIIAEFAFIPLRTTQWRPEWANTIQQYGWWAAGSIAGWVMVPTLLLGWWGNERPFSVLPPTTTRGLALYGALIAAMIPLLLLAGLRPDFLRNYPLLHPAPGVTWSGALLLGYWLCYGSILFSTEYLFRGVLLFGLESRLGVHAVGVSVLPYCLIHVHKPWPEALGSIVAGYVLGILALRTRSIGGGVLVHCAVAFGMDTVSLVRNHAWPERLLP